MSGWLEHECQACGNRFWGPEEDLHVPVCWHCINDFGIETKEDWEELHMLFGFGNRDHGGNGHADQKQIHNAKREAAPKPDPVKVAQGVRSQCDYAVMPADGGEMPTPRKAITYYCAKNGLFEVRHSEVATIITKPKEVLGVTQELKEGVKLNLPKIPFTFLQQTVAFFRGVEKRRNSSSEAIVQIWWDTQEKRHQMHVPEQQVGGASVHHNSTFDQANEGRYIHFADIHSHTSSMSAFWSGTDNADERRVCGERVFGVIGKINQPIPDWKWRLGTRGGFIDLNITDVVEMPTEDFRFNISANELYRCINDPSLFKDGRVSLWCPVSPFNADVEVPEEWYAQVKGHTVGSFHDAGRSNYYHANRGHYGMQQRLPDVVRGMIYVDGEEFEVDGAVLRKTGNKLIRKGEALPPELQK